MTSTMKSIQRRGLGGHITQAIKERSEKRKAEKARLESARAMTEQARSQAYKSALREQARIQARKTARRELARPQGRLRAVKEEAGDVRIRAGRSARRAGENAARAYRTPAAPRRPNPEPPTLTFPGLGPETRQPPGGDDPWAIEFNADGLSLDLAGKRVTSRNVLEGSPLTNLRLVGQPKKGSPLDEVLFW